MKKQSNFIGFRDIVIITLLSTLNIIMSLIVSIPFTASQHLVLFVANGLIMIIGGPIFILALTKAPRKGAMMLFILVFAIYISLIGQPIIGFIFAISSVICELTLVGGGYHKPLRVGIAYMAYAACYSAGSYVPYLFSTDSLIKGLELQGFSQEAIISVVNIYSSPLIISLAIINSVVWATLGAFIGYKMLKKHFKPAGVA